MPSATIKWTPVPGVDGYYIFRSQPINGVLAKGNTFTDHSILPNHVYMYEVRSFQNGVLSLESHPAEVDIIK